MIVDRLLSRLEKVKRTGKGNWLACCPAHDDKHPSLGISEGSDGRILVRCYAHQCDIWSIASAVGLEISDFFPEKLKSDFSPGVKRAFPAADVLEAMAQEALIVWVAAANMANGETLTPADYSRLRMAAERIEAARNLALSR